MIFDAVAEPWWDDRPLFVLGGGPSLIERDLTRLHDRGRVLGLNRAAADTTCHAVFSLDRSFIEKWAAWLAAQARAGLEVYAAVGADWDQPILPGVRYLERRQGKGICTDPRAVTNGLNTGYGAINLAVNKSAWDIVLLGFDLHPTKNGASHWHPGYPWHTGSADIYFERWAKRFEELAETLPPGVRVRNANPRSAVRCFPFATYEEFGL